MPPILPDLVIVDVAFACSLGSVAGAIFIIGNWACNGAARRVFFLRLIAYLAVANLLSACAYMMSFVEWRILGRGTSSPVLDDDTSQWYCLIQALGIVIFEYASVLWTVAIALALHQQVVVRRVAPEALERWYHLVCWGVPMLIALGLLLAHRLGPADEPRTAWCWIVSHWDGPTNHTLPPHHVPVSDGGGGDARWVQLVCFYLPLLCAFVFNLLTYIRVGDAFRRMVREGAVDANKERVIQLRLRLYLGVFLAVWLAPLIHRAAQIFGGDAPWLRILHTATQCSMGTLNGIVYGCNEATLQPYREVLSQLSCSLLELTRPGGLFGRGHPRAEAVAADGMSTATAGLLAGASVLDTAPQLPPLSSDDEMVARIGGVTVSCNMGHHHQFATDLYDDGAGVTMGAAPAAAAQAVAPVVIERDANQLASVIERDAERNQLASPTASNFVPVD